MKRKAKSKPRKRQPSRTELAVKVARAMLHAQHKRDERDTEILIALQLIAKNIHTMNETLPALLHARQFRSIVSGLPIKVHHEE